MSLRTISANTLEHVTGGKSPTAGTGASNTSNDQLLTTLQGIHSGLKDLGKNNNSGPFGNASGLLFMTMALALSRRGQVVVQGGSSGHSYSWRASW